MRVYGVATKPDGVTYALGRDGEALFPVQFLDGGWVDPDKERVVVEPKSAEERLAELEASRPAPVPRRVPGTPVPRPTSGDYVVFVEMLQRAGIEFRQNEDENWAWVAVEGGYSGFYSEMAFEADGSLRSVAAWE